MQTNQTPEALAEECKRLATIVQTRQFTPGNAGYLELLYAIDRLRDDLIAAQSRGAHLESECQLATHKVITCGVAARHPDAALASTGAYAGEWDSPQAQEVRDLRADRDRLRDMAASGAKDAISFEQAAQHLMKWLGGNVHPHHTAVVTSTDAELLEGKQTIRTTQYVKD